MERSGSHILTQWLISSTDSGASWRCAPPSMTREMHHTAGAVFLPNNVTKSTKKNPETGPYTADWDTLKSSVSWGKKGGVCVCETILEN